jgi:hypothetical protein
MSYQPIADMSFQGLHWIEASDAAPNKTIVRSDKSNHSGCSTQAISASA